MKFFTISTPDDSLKEATFHSKTAVKRALQALPSLEGVLIYRHWWSRDDYVDCSEYKPEDFLNTKAKDLTRGATAQWACPRGQL